MSIVRTTQGIQFLASVPLALPLEKKYAYFKPLLSLLNKNYATLSPHLVIFIRFFFGRASVI